MCTYFRTFTQKVSHNSNRMILTYFIFYMFICRSETLINNCSVLFCFRGRSAYSERVSYSEHSQFCDKYWQYVFLSS